MMQTFINSISYPFKDAEWPSKLGPILLISLIPIVDIVVLLGWQLLLIRHFSEGRSGLPKCDWEWIFKKGVLLLLIIILFVYVLPSMLLSYLGVSGIGGLIDDYKTWTSGSAEVILTDWISDMVVEFAVYLIWGILWSPLMYAALVRSALTGSLKAFFQIPANVAFLARHMTLFIKFYLFGLLFAVFVFAVDLALSITGIGVALVPLVSAWLYFFMTSYELGHIAHVAAGGHEPQDAEAFGLVETGTQMDVSEVPQESE